MTFCDARDQLRAGQRVRRAMWPAGAYVYRDGMGPWKHEPGVVPDRRWWSSDSDQRAKDWEVVL